MGPGFRRDHTLWLGGNVPRYAAPILALSNGVVW